jgi:excisionase family DNA binding protein
MEQEKFTVKETARMVHRSPDTIYRWIEEGFLQNFIKVRDGYLIPKTEIERILIQISLQK